VATKRFKLRQDKYVGTWAIWDTEKHCYVKYTHREDKKVVKQLCDTMNSRVAQGTYFEHGGN
jgi:hypothetical protein